MQGLLQQKVYNIHPESNQSTNRLQIMAKFVGSEIHWLLWMSILVVIIRVADLTGRKGLSPVWHGVYFTNFINDRKLHHGMIVIYNVY